MTIITILHVKNVMVLAKIVLALIWKIVQIIKYSVQIILST